MQAYEFYAMPRNGVIPMPEQYIGKFTKRIKVILIEQTSEAVDYNERKRTDFLSPISIDTRGWKFDKEEANER
jgi:penicillin-binding protein-related factor A (putative recombinase)